MDNRVAAILDFNIDSVDLNQLLGRLKEALDGVDGGERWEVDTWPPRHILPTAYRPRLSLGQGRAGLSFGERSLYVSRGERWHAFLSRADVRVWVRAVVFAIADSLGARRALYSSNLSVSRVGDPFDFVAEGKTIEEIVAAVSARGRPAPLSAATAGYSEDLWDSSVYLIDDFSDSERLRDLLKDVRRSAAILRSGGTRRVSYGDRLRAGGRCDQRDGGEEDFRRQGPTIYESSDRSCA